MYHNLSGLINLTDQNRWKVDAVPEKSRGSLPFATCAKVNIFCEKTNGMTNLANRDVLRDQN
jgi:hypothetical protein